MRRGQGRRADRGHEDDFDAVSSRPTTGASRHGTGEDGIEAIIIADTQDNPGAAAIPTPQACCAAWSATTPPARHRRDLRSAIGKAAHAAGSAPLSRSALGGKSGIPGDAPYQETFMRRETVGRKIRGARPYYGGRDMDMGRRRPCASAISGWS